jgi:ketosteroid isomerase-like protein
MLQRNVEVVLEGLDAINRRDADAFLGCLGPEVEWVESGDVFPGLRGVHRGRAQARRWFVEAILDPWDDMNVEVEEITEASDGRVFAGFIATARGRASGVETELRFWTTFWFSDGKIARRQVYWTRGEALEAAGLRE